MGRNPRQPCNNLHRQSRRMSSLLLVSRRKQGCFSLTALLSVLVLGGCESKPIREVKRLGGTVTIDKYRTWEVEAVDLHETEVTDADLAHLEGFKNLRRLTLFSTKITGAGLIHIRDLTELRDLNLAFTAVSDPDLQRGRVKSCVNSFGASSRLTPVTLLRSRPLRHAWATAPSHTTEPKSDDAIDSTVAGSPGTPGTHRSASS